MNAIGPLTTVLLGALTAPAVAVIAIAIIVVIGNRDPDREGLRPFTVYAFAMSFVALWVAVVGSFVVVRALFGLIGPSLLPRADGVARAALAGGLMVLLGTAVLLVHLRSGMTIAASEPAGGPNARVARTYVASVLFVAVVLGVVAFAMLVWFAFAAVGPGTFGGSTVRNVWNLLDSGWLLLVAIFVVGTHEVWMPPAMSPFRRRAVATSGPASDATASS